MVLVALSALLHAIEKERVSVFADLLVWNATESGADNWAQVFSTSGFSPTIDVLDVAFDWNPGIRLGLNWDMGYDGWDTQFFYTWFCTHGYDQDMAPAGGYVASSFIGNFFANNSGGTGLSGPKYQSANIKWSLYFSIFDWELGRNFQVANILTLRPFIGLKGGWINQRIDSNWQNPIDTTPSFTSAVENLKNDFWGIGPSLGLNTKWDLGSSFHFFGDFSGALLWGHWTFADLYQNNVPESVTVNLSNINGVAPMTRAFMGFGWQKCWSGSRICMRLGYEMQFWLNQLQYYVYNTARLNNQLSFQGGVFDFCYDF
ncbi:MAG: Lpg1974 family pore-forming outer membrane protein [Chlamydiales bacterium]|nr:Lpg1974 family pore-forming outer membrane protein [Chlamydiales bacterium]